MAKGALNPKQQRFVEEYVVDLNAKQAAVRAGYAPRSAEVAGYRLLRDARVQEAIRARNAAKAEENKLTAARVLEELALLAFSDLGEVLDFTGDHPRLRRACEIPARARRTISSIKVKRYVEGAGDDAQAVEVTEFKLWSKDAALDKLARHFALLTDRHEVTGKDGKPLIPIDALREILRRAGKA